MIRILALVLMLAIVYAQPRGRKAHEHGSVKVDIAFETTAGAPKGVLAFEAPADSVIGFEYAAKSAADQKRQADALALLKIKMGDMVQFPAGCRLTAKSAAVVIEKNEHAEVRAEFDVACAKPLSGAEVRFGFAKVFPRITGAEVALLAGEQQSSLAVKNDKGVLRIGQ